MNAASMNPYLLNILLGLGEGVVILVAVLVLAWIASLIRRAFRLAFPLPTDAAAPTVYPTPELTAAFAQLDEQNRRIDELLGKRDN